MASGELSAERVLPVWAQSTRPLLPPSRFTHTRFLGSCAFTSCPQAFAVNLCAGLLITCYFCVAGVRFLGQFGQDAAADGRKEGHAGWVGSKQGRAQEWRGQHWRAAINRCRTPHVPSRFYTLACRTAATPPSPSRPRASWAGVAGRDTRAHCAPRPDSGSFLRTRTDGGSVSSMTVPDDSVDSFFSNLQSSSRLVLPRHDSRRHAFCGPPGPGMHGCS